MCLKLAFCVACGSINLDALEHHHLLPRSAGGGDEEANLITLCHSCHGRMHGYERANIGRLTREGLRTAKERGVKLGNRKNLSEAGAMGNAKNREAADVFARQILPIIDSIRGQGITSYEAIARELTARRIPTARGGEWKAMTVSRIMARAA